MGPLYGTWSYNNLGFQTACDVVAYMSFFYGVVYFMFGSGFQAFKNSSFRPVEDEKKRIASNIGQGRFLSIHDPAYLVANRAGTFANSIVWDKQKTALVKTYKQK